MTVPSSSSSVGIFPRGFGVGFCSAGDRANGADPVCRPDLGDRDHRFADIR